MLKAETILQSIGAALILGVASRFLVFGRGVLFARTLDPVELGVWAMTINAIQIAAYLLVFGVPNGLSRYLGRHLRCGSIAPFLLQACGKTICLAAIACGMAVLILPQLGVLIYGDADRVALVLFVLTGAVATVGLFLAKAVLQGLRKFRLEAALELLYNLGFLVLLAILFAAWRTDAVANSLAYVTVTVAVTLAIMTYAIVAVRSPAADGEASVADGEWSSPWRTLLWYSAGTWSASAVLLIWRYLDRYMLLHLGNSGNVESLHQIGDYFVATKVAEPIGAFAIMIGAILLPHLAHLWETGRRREVAASLGLATKITALVLLLIGAGVVVVKDLALWLIVGEVSPVASMIVPPVIVTVIAVALYYVIRSYILCHEKAWWLGAVWVAALLLNAALNVWLIAHYGLYGAVTATFISALVALFAVLAISRRLGMPVPSGTWAICAAPLVLVFPAEVFLPVVAAVMLSVVFTDWILDVEEKSRVNRWSAVAVRPLMDRWKPAAPDASFAAQTTKLSDKRKLQS